MAIATPLYGAEKFVKASKALVSLAAAATSIDLTRNFIKYPHPYTALDATSTDMQACLKFAEPFAGRIHIQIYTKEACPLARKGNTCLYHGITTTEALAIRTHEATKDFRKKLQ